tara:strand:- start:1055 stop:2101 length:1047 start_codon:yes stop_codon:yes gene_type:complete
MSFKRKILITGGAGFIGSHLVRHLVNKYSDYLIINFDSLTYAGNLYNLQDIEDCDNYHFFKGDINNTSDLENIFLQHDINGVIHLAAESHVDRSIDDPNVFIKTNVLGTTNILNVCKKYWKNNYKNKLFYHVSTDEVYGSLDEGLFSENTPYDPRSPYSASKASSDHFVRAYGNTYNLPFVISNCSNNYGPNQFPEKLIPVIISNIKNKKTLPVYGDGLNIRDWLYVIDHAIAIDLIFHKGKIGETYNVGGNNEISNIELVKQLCLIMDKKLKNKKSSEKLIKYVEDRPGHDARYAIDCTKLSSSLGWAPTVNFNQGLQKTVSWYLKNFEWIENIVSGEYLEYYENNF